ncbi:hypothetical protein [Bacillus sp. FJAT-50079]|uniref:hypothetical protein n=1 Tax=Bacillus sp. FJAT-50079 TaxID=2833577 RepID=UPI001BC90672|nr:hypothetical protein [Bacillus sp. FJAT-50079]MBS4207503.1 hypothetical protein [Bacillus sp. FJAT-50079]
MPGYIEGFNDGYKKALELIGKPQLNVTMDGKEIAKVVYKDVEELNEQDRARNGKF